MRQCFLVECVISSLFALAQAQTSLVVNPSQNTHTHSTACETVLLDTSTCRSDVEWVTKQTTSSSFDKSVSSTAPPETPEPQPAPPVVHFAWNLSYPQNQVANAPRVSPVWDKKMWVAHVVYAGATIVDVEVTHQGLAHHRCVEDSNVSDGLPSRGSLYLNNVLLEFVPITALDWVAASGVRSAHSPRWLWKPIGYVGATWGSIRHLRNGFTWISDSCY
jgi:hypothetical protein